MSEFTELNILLASVLVLPATWVPNIRIIPGQFVLIRVPDIQVVLGQFVLIRVPDIQVVLGQLVLIQVTDTQIALCQTSRVHRNCLSLLPLENLFKQIKHFVPPVSLRRSFGFLRMSVWHFCQRLNKYILFYVNCQVFL